MQAVFRLLDWRRNRLLGERFARGDAPGELLWALIHLGVDRLTRGFTSAGGAVYENEL
jgi:hypothetical protein